MVVQASNSSAAVDNAVNISHLLKRPEADDRSFLTLHDQRKKERGFCIQLPYPSEERPLELAVDSKKESILSLDDKLQRKLLLLNHKRMEDGVEVEKRWFSQQELAKLREAGIIKPRRNQLYRESFAAIQELFTQYLHGGLAINKS